jgi:hypothetical protein
MKKPLDIQTEMIGPEEATKYLSLNKPGNRKILKRNLDGLTREMKEDRFQPMNGDTIRFNVKGELIDGQHRLKAIVASGKTYIFLVVRGVSEAAFETIDEGAIRSLKDYIGMLPGPESHYYNEVASAVRWCMLWYKMGTFRKKPVFTTTEKLQWLKDNPKIRMLVGYYKSPKASLRMSTSMQATCHFILEAVNPDLADTYMTSVIEGLDMQRGDPRYTVREWIIRYKEYGSLYYTAHAGHVILRGWNFWRRGETWSNVKQPDLAPGSLEK